MRSGLNTAGLLLLLSVFALSAVAPVHASTVQNCTASPGGQCIVSVFLNSGDQVSGSISVSGGSGNDINFYVTDPSGAQVYAAGRVSGGGNTFAFSADTSGAYTLHFDNSFSILSSKSVAVSYDVSSTLVPGLSPEYSYLAVIAAVIIVLMILYFVLRSRRKGRTQQPSV